MGKFELDYDEFLEDAMHEVSTMLQENDIEDYRCEIIVYSHNGGEKMLEVIFETPGLFQDCLIPSAALDQEHLKDLKSHFFQQIKNGIKAAKRQKSALESAQSLFRPNADSPFR